MKEISLIITEMGVTVQTAPYVKPHFVLIVAVATVLLIGERSAHREWSD